MKHAGEGTRTLPRLDNGALHATEVTSHVRDEVLLLRVVEDLLPERARLLEVELGHLRQVERGAAEPVLVLRGVVRAVLRRELERLDGGLVVRAVALRDERHRACALEVGGVISPCFWCRSCSSRV